MSTTDDNNDWLEMIHTALAHGMTKQAIANVVGVDRSYISQAVHNLGNLGNGKCSPKHLAQKVRNTLGAFPCPFLTDESGQEVRITGLVCRGYAHKEMPTANPREIRHWRACQDCPKKQTSALPPHKVAIAAPAGVKAQVGKCGKASSGSEASDEGWNCVGGPMDNPYPEEDTRHDYWAQGFQQRREFDRKQRERLRGKNVDDVQQAGVIDTVTLPLPEVGGPQISKGSPQ